VALRTAGATLLLAILIALFRRSHFYIYPVGLVGCGLAGLLNGIGSLLYYVGLARVDASLGHLLFSLYPLFVALLLVIDGYRYTLITYLRLGLSLPAVYLLTVPGGHEADLLGIILMLAAGFLYAIHIPINQRVLYEVPAPTVTLYTLAAMTLTVVPVALVAGPPPETWGSAGLLPVAGLTLVTFLARLTLFQGVKSIGGMDTALIGLAELLVTLLLARIWLGETLTPIQWLGAGLLMISVFLIGLDQRRQQQRPAGGWLRWLLPPVSCHPASRVEMQPADEGNQPADGPGSG
jgi:drug/metabolite transporter (DMT)-like permease